VVNVLILSDVCLYREGLVRILAAEPDLRVVAAASSESEAAAELAVRATDVVLIDLATPRALDSARALARRFPGASIVALGVRDDEEGVVECAEAGITGYVHRDGTTAELIDAIRCAHTGELRCTRVAAGALIRRLAVLSGNVVREGPPTRLTPRQVQIVRLLDEGLTNKEIASNLSISPATVRNHVHMILEKLGARTRARAAAVVRASLPGR